MFRHYVPEYLTLTYHELALLGIKAYAVDPTLNKHFNQVINMLYATFRVDTKIIHENFKKVMEILLKSMGHQPLECGGRIGETEGHHPISKRAPFCSKGGFMLILQSNG